MAEKLYSYADKQVMDEMGSSGGDYSPLIIHVNENMVFDKTWKQIHDHMISGGTAVTIMPDDPEHGHYDAVLTVTSIERIVEDGVSTYLVGILYGDCVTDNENGHPVLS